MTSFRFSVPCAPASQQASAAAKEELRQAVRRSLVGVRYFLTGEVRLSIEWFVHDRARYETDSSPDVDNILKPLIDALCGPDGILVDDCQIQRVTCGWIDWEREDQAVEIEIDYFDDEVIPSREIFFIRFSNGLCFPFDRKMSVDTVRTLVRHLQERLAARDRVVEETQQYHAGLNIMPIQRFFHRTRIHGFDVSDCQQYLDAAAGDR